MTSLGTLVEAACVLEARARKPGNVHPEASFSDMTYEDFVASARCIAPVFDRATELSVGQLVLDGVKSTRRLVEKNTNLGILLVLAPLAKATVATREAVNRELERLTLEDARQVYQAIRLARPGGLGTVDEQDVQSEPTVTLLKAMGQAAEWDLIARQYANGFQDVLTLMLPTLEQALAVAMPLEQAIILTHLTSLATLGDTLIRRKCGPALKDTARRLAHNVLDQGWPNRPAGLAAFFEFDRWLRADGHRRNPGTTADLLVGALFLALRRGSIELPLTHPWECSFL